MYSRANMTSPMTILRYIQYIDSKSRVELSWGALGVRTRIKSEGKTNCRRCFSGEYGRPLRLLL